MQVLKFGGSSVANAGNINKVKKIVFDALKKQPTFVVVSAFGGVTDALLHTANLASKGNSGYKSILEEIEKKHLDAVRELMPIPEQSATLSWVKQQFNLLESLCEGVFILTELPPRIKDKIASFGELLSSYIIAASFKVEAKDIEWVDARTLIRTNNICGNAAVLFQETNQQINDFLHASSSRLFIAPGFIASDSDGYTTTLGRGGSDYSGAIFAAALQATVLEIWTDVNGMMTADPRLVNQPKRIERISYQEAMELSHFGAKIIYPPTIQPVMSKNIPVWLKNTFEPEESGTIIEHHSTPNDDIIRGISSINNIALLSLEGSGMVGIPGFSKRLFETLATNLINVILITQSSSEHSICVGINENDADIAAQKINESFDYEIQTKKVDPVIVEKGLSIVAVVGEQMKSHPGISGKMFGALGRNGINVRAVAQGSSEKNISAVLSHADVKKAINVLHEAFFETTYKQINVFIAGTGNVGNRLIAQIAQQFDYLKEHLKIQVVVVGLANSKQNIVEEGGIDLRNWQQILLEAPKATIHDFVQNIIDKNCRNSVFVDVTANENVASVYEKLLEKSIAVVACNKIASSAHFSRYKRLKSLSSEFNAPFLFETNVGAGLLVISTLNDLMRSGDEIIKIQAVLSGTLNFVFNQYDATVPFAQVVKKAQEEGYTEPDPRLDLGGTDVMRKIMILAREAGVKIEMQEIENTYFLPETCFNGSVDDFYQELLVQENHFKNLYKKAADQQCKLKFVAEFEKGKAKVGLQFIPPHSDFYHVYGKDNLVLFYTKRYAAQPLVIKGAGAGAEVTASGVFADILRVGK